MTSSDCDRKDDGKQTNKIYCHFEPWKYLSIAHFVRPFFERNECAHYLLVVCDRLLFTADTKRGRAGRHEIGRNEKSRRTMMCPPPSSGPGVPGGRENGPVSGPTHTRGASFCRPSGGWGDAARLAGWPAEITATGEITKGKRRTAIALATDFGWRALCHFAPDG